MGKLPALRVGKNANGSLHVPILGAGASVASFRKGDRNGRQLPVIANFVDVLGLRPLFKELGLAWLGDRMTEELLHEREGRPLKRF